MLKKIFVVFILLFCNFLTFSESNYKRDSGSASLTINAGTIGPLFFHDFVGSSGKTNLNWGGLGSIEFDWHLGKTFRLGTSLAGSFLFDVNGLAMYMVPISLKISWLPGFGDFDIPFGFDIGGNMMWYLDAFTVAPIIKPNVGFIWNYDNKWAFGATFKYWYSVDLIFGANKDQTTAGNFLEFTISAIAKF